MSKLNKIDMKKIRTEAEMADVTVMGLEVEERYYSKPVEEVIQHHGIAFRRTITPFEQRKRGPNLVKLSHNKNSTRLGDIFPELAALTV